MFCRREQIQVSVPRQRIRQRGSQLRRPRPASHGPGSCGGRAGRPDTGRCFQTLPVAQRTAQPVQRQWRVFDHVMKSGRGKSMPEENGNGKNGNRVGLLERVKAGVKEDVQSLKTDLRAKAKEQVEGLKDPTKTQVYTSIFRHKHDDTPRNRALGVLSNVFLHLHPAKINRDAVRYSYTWGMGGITFYLFIVLTLTGVMLMFYYHPSKVQAFRDVLYLEHDVPFGKILRNMHRWAAHLMVIAVWLHMFRVFLTGSYKKPREFNWNIGVLLLVFTLLLSFTGYLLPDDQLGFWAVTVGTNMARATPLLGHEGPFGSMLGMTPYNDVRFGLLGGSIVDANALLRSYIWHCIGIPIVASILMIVHFWRVRKDGGISGPAPVMLEAEADKPRRGPKAAGDKEVSPEMLFATSLPAAFRTIARET